MPARDTDSVFSLDGRVALVTGASGGLGRRFATVLAAHGARVAAAARRRDRLDGLVAGIGEAGGTAIAVEMDVSVEDSVIAGFHSAEAAFGTVDILVNNAGIGARLPATQVTMDDWRRTMDVNLDAVFRVAQEAARRMAAAGREGAIVNVSSMLGRFPRRGFAAYGAAKAAVIQLTRVLALELAEHGICVNALAPGYFETEMTADYLASEAGRRMVGRIPLGRSGELADLDGALLVLASHAGRYITGQTLVVDGGQSIAIP